MLKSVRVYFNTKRMSAILKALQNRTVNVELKSEVVELGVVDDMGKSTDLMKTIANEFKANLKTINTAYDLVIKLDKQAADAQIAANKLDSSISKVNSKAEKALSNVDKIYGRLEKAAKELGVSVKDVKGYKEWDSMEAELDKLITQGKEFI